MKNKIKNKKLGKKGSFEVIGDIPTWLITALVIIIFLILFKAAGCFKNFGKIETTMNVNVAAEESKMNYDTLTFLRQPVEVNGEELSVADLVSAKMEIAKVYEKRYRDKYGDARAEIIGEYLNNLEPFSGNDKIIFQGKETTVKDVKDTYEKYLARAKKFDEFIKYFEDNYPDCYAISIKKGDLEIIYNTVVLGDSPENPAPETVYVLPDYDKAISFKMSFSPEALQPDGSKRCKEYAEQLEVN